jgi:competence protein ComEC
VVRAFAPGVRFATSASGTEQACHGHRWRWDGVDFRLLAVRRPESASENDRSCVLLVDDGSARMLIAGDVSARVEADLLRRIPDPGRGVDLLFAPHHGSRTSSSRAMVRVLKPRQVWVSAGRANRFGHPHRDTVARYDEVRAVMHQTGRAGALTWHSAAPEKVDHWRAHAPYWRRESVASSR